MCIDNFAAISDSARASTEGLAGMLAAFARAGVVASADALGGNEFILLGCELVTASGLWRVQRKRFWRLHGALTYLLSSGVRVTGQEIERIIGHLLAACMLR